MSDQGKGLYKKFDVKRVSDPTGKYADCDYFVLDLKHDKHAPAALYAYAYDCEDDFPQLSKELQELASSLCRPSVVEAVDHGD